MSGVSIREIDYIRRRIRACDYLTVAQLFLQGNFLLERKLICSDIKPRLLGHWGTCHGINVAYANLFSFFRDDSNFSFILGPGHGFPALQANLFIDGELAKVDEKAAVGVSGLEYICRNFSWPDGFPSHSSPFTPGIIVEGGELGYALANAYGVALGHPEKTIAVLIGDGELETATGLASLNLKNLLSGARNGRILPILHLNGYKISGPTIYGRKSERELFEMIRGFGFTPVLIDGDDPEVFQGGLSKFLQRPSEKNPEDARDLQRPSKKCCKKYNGFELGLCKNENPFFILRTEKGEGGPNRHDAAHQIPLKNPATDMEELKILEDWMRSYRFEELFDEEKGFLL
ncbi:MAG: hypothetical protein Q4B65_00065 [Candidatus Saccharibacteria bacterium]|nr:hypothetical protein [Candidatus Saccharibacteria bacterium]